MVNPGDSSASVFFNLLDLFVRYHFSERHDRGQFKSVPLTDLPDLLHLFNFNIPAQRVAFKPFFFISFSFGKILYTRVND